MTPHRYGIHEGYQLAILLPAGEQLCEHLVLLAEDTLLIGHQVQNARIIFRVLISTIEDVLRGNNRPSDSSFSPSTTVRPVSSV